MPARLVLPRTTPILQRALRSTMSTTQSSSSSSSRTPLEDAIRAKLTTALSPTQLTIANDSAAHAHHAAMAGNTSRETHFRVTVVSDAFRAKPQPARHRMVYRVLGEELAGGVHALQLRTRTVEEEERSAAADAAEGGS